MAEKFAPTTTPDWQAAVRRRTRFYVLVAVLLAVLFGFLVFQFFSRQQRLAPGELTPAVFAAQDIEIGTLLTSELLDVRDVSIRAVPDSHLTFEEQAIGKLALYPLAKGEVVLPEKLAGDQGGAVTQRCPSGKWCVSIPVAWFIAAPPSPDPWAGAYGIAMGDRYSPSLLIPAGPIDTGRGSGERVQYAA